MRATNVTVFVLLTTCTLHFTAAGSAKVEVNDQQIQTEIVETEHKSVQVGSTPKQRGVFATAWWLYLQVFPQFSFPGLVLYVTVVMATVYPSSPSAVGYLRGVEVIDHTSFTYTGRAQSFEWANRGFKLHIPENALPPEVDECRFHITASLSGQFQFPEDSELVSGIYWIATPHKFAKPATVEIQHCSLKTEHPASLTYVVAKCTQEDLPYHFKIVHGGVFVPSSQYGSINLTHFSGVGIASQSPRRPSLIPRPAHRYQAESKLFNEKRYFARLYYRSNGIHSWEIYFTIMWNLDLHIRVSIPRVLIN